MTAVEIIVAVYAAVLVAEVIGDRSVYTIASLTARFRPGAVLAGVAPAYALKMAVAVLIADAVTHLPAVALAVVSCVTWLVTGWAVWRREEEHAAVRWAGPPAVIAFASIAFTEWGDPGQLAAALLAAHFKAPLLVWSGATAALLTKAAAALVVGLTARRFLAMTWIRAAAAIFCLVNAALAVTFIDH